MDKIKRHQHQLVIGIPSKGRIKEIVLDFLATKGYRVPENLGRRLDSHFIEMEDHRLVFFHAKDIPIFVQNELIDIGFTGLDLIYEAKAKVRPVIKVSKEPVRLMVAVPSHSSYIHPSHLINRNIATPYPNIAREYFEKLKVPVCINPIQGASEIMPYLGTTDAILDVVETGNSLRDNDLRVIDNNVYESMTVCIVKRPEFSSNHQLIHQFLRKLY